MIGPTPLKPNPYNLTTQFVLCSAYSKCLNLEPRHEQVQNIVRLPVLVCARFLGYMLLEAPTDGGREDFAWEIGRCSGDDAMQEQAQLYSDHLLRICKSEIHIYVCCPLSHGTLDFSSQK